jgi:hypothetical protein
MRKLLSATISCLLLTACGSGGGGASNSSSGSGGAAASSFQNHPLPPSPYPTEGRYNGLKYSELGNPTGITQKYPDSFVSTNSSPSAQIAYGRNSDVTVANLTAQVHLGSSICSATPVYYDENSDTTFLVSAAHCFVRSKSSTQTVIAGEMLNTSEIHVYNGIGSNLSDWQASFAVRAVYIQPTYCYNNSFADGGWCTNFTPQNGAANGQGNDIAIIQINGKYADPALYPQIAPSSEYPATYSMAPVLSIGYGVNTQTPETNLPSSCEVGSTCGVMYYAVNYQYWQQDSVGYHYLYNSKYNNGEFGQTGYAAMTCSGDSGGGDVFWNGEHWILLSEHSYGPTGACGGFYNDLRTAATNVSAYYDWVSAIIHNSDPITSSKNGVIANCVTNGA